MLLRTTKNEHVLFLSFAPPCDMYKRHQQEGGGVSKDAVGLVIMPVTSRPASLGFKMVAKFVVAEAVKNQEFFRDKVVNFIEFSNDRIPLLIKK